MNSGEKFRLAASTAVPLHFLVQAGCRLSFGWMNPIPPCIRSESGCPLGSSQEDYGL